MVTLQGYFKVVGRVFHMNRLTRLRELSLSFWSDFGVVLPPLGSLKRFTLDADDNGTLTIRAAPGVGEQPVQLDHLNLRAGAFDLDPVFEAALKALPGMETTPNSRRFTRV